MSGLVSASSKLLLSSSFNQTGDAECQKPHSKYIDLIAEWRLDPQLFSFTSSSIVKLFPEALDEDRIRAVRFYHICLRGFVAAVGILGVAVFVLKRRSGGVAEVVANLQAVSASKAHVS